jgi:hypothetical protein
MRIDCECGAVCFGVPATIWVCDCGAVWSYGGARSKPRVIARFASVLAARHALEQLGERE